MANFKTHRNIGIFVSGVSSASVYFLSLQKENLFSIDLTTSYTTLFLMLFFGTIGSIFPDIDLKTSTPSKFMRYFLIFVLSFFMFGFLQSNQTLIFNFDFFNQLNLNKYSLFIFIGISLFFPLIVIKFLEGIMEHRGIVHSVPFALLSSIILFLGINSINSSFLNMDINSFLVSFFFFIGFLTHLLLDEIYSVNLLGMEIKSSFGSAFSFFSYENKIGYFILYFLIILFFYNIFNF